MQKIIKNLTFFSKTIDISRNVWYNIITGNERTRVFRKEKTNGKTTKEKEKWWSQTSHHRNHHRSYKPVKHFDYFSNKDNWNVRQVTEKRSSEFRTSNSYSHLYYRIIFPFCQGYKYAWYFADWFIRCINSTVYYNDCTDR